MLGVAAMLLSACALAGGRPDPTFDLQAPTDVPAGATNAQILVPPPSAVAVLNTERMVVRAETGELSYLPDAQWADKLPVLFQARLIESFENTGRTRAVGRPGEGLLIDVQVIVTLRQFEIDASARTARVVVAVKLINDRNGRAIATRRFGAESVLTDLGAESSVGGLNDASSQVMREIVGWTLGRI